MNSADIYRQFGQVIPNSRSRQGKVTKCVVYGVLTLSIAAGVLFTPKIWVFCENLSYPSTPASEEDVGVKMGQGYFVQEYRVGDP